MSLTSYKLTTTDAVRTFCWTSVLDMLKYEDYLLVLTTHISTQKELKIWCMAYFPLRIPSQPILAPFRIYFVGMVLHMFFFLKLVTCIFTVQ